jgi:hypothetical protein
MYQWLRRGYGLISRFTGSSLVVTRISFDTLKIAVTIALAKSHMSLLILLLATVLFPWNLGTQGKLFPISIFSHILSARTTHRKQFCCYVAQTTQKTSRVVTISLIHWLSDCYLAKSCKHSSYYCLATDDTILSRFIAWLHTRLGLMNGFTNHLFTRLGTTSNYSATANLHNSLFITASAKPLLAYCLQQPFPGNGF